MNILRRRQLGVKQVYLFHRARCAANLHILVQLVGPKQNQHEPRRQIAQRALQRQPDRQRRGTRPRIRSQTATDNVAAELEALAALSNQELRTRWEEFYGTPSPPRMRPNMSVMSLMIFGFSSAENTSLMVFTSINGIVLSF